MLAYMNRESLRKTLETGYTWFWSDVYKRQITDYTSSVTCKMFDSNNVIDSIVNRLSQTKTIMVTGRYQPDVYKRQGFR